MKSDEFYIKKTLRLALKGEGRTSPNPMVGALVVKNDNIIGKGYHKKAGSIHAEIAAMDDAGREVEGSTLYISLEPCSHFGQTPPCVDQIITRKVGRVVFSMRDPNPLVSGRGEARLADAGIETKAGVLESDSRILNEVFIKYITTGRPFVILKLALSLDGKIATKTGDSKWITSEESRLLVHKKRNVVDANMVGVGTVLRDNPKLTTRLANNRGHDPIRVVVDSLLKIPLKANIFTEKSAAQNIIFTTEASYVERGALYEKLPKTKVLVVGASGRNKVSLSQVADRLGSMQVGSLLIEGGAEIGGSAIKDGIVDKVMFFIAPKIIGGRNAPSPVGGDGITYIKDAIKLHSMNVSRSGPDILVEGYLSSIPQCVWKEPI